MKMIFRQYRLIQSLYVVVFAAATTLFGTGCAPEEEIKTYTAPRDKAESSPFVEDRPEVGGQEYRIVGAMFPKDDPRWFFKVTTEATEIEPYLETVDQFLASIEFPGGADQRPKWNLPDGWKEGPARPFVDATILFGNPQKPITLTVSQARGGLQQNLARWAEQVGMKAEFETVAEQTTDISTPDNVTGVRVDFRGPKNPSGSRPPFMGK